MQYRIISTQAFKDIIPFIINKLNCKQQVQLFLKSNCGLLDQQNIELLRMTNKALSSSNLSFTHYFIVFKDSAEKKMPKVNLTFFCFGWTLHRYLKHKDSLSDFEAFCSNYCDNHNDASWSLRDVIWCSLASLLSWESLWWCVNYCISHLTHINNTGV